MNTKTLIGMVAAASMALLLASGGAFAQSASPDAANPNKKLKGTFTYLSHGDYEYYPAVGIMAFDGAGNITGTMDFNDDGTPCPGITLSGTYTVNSDNTTGTGALTLATSTSGCGNGATVALAFSISSGGKTVYLQEMDGYTTGTFADNFDVIFEAAATSR
ncbi:MAG TPA: hypothetical protein VNF27_15345 [Candidatus Binataceae bacterium]|nr:hypothetical protein [Candidatus Binataceae bacterium]